MTSEDIEAQIEAYTAEGLQSRKARLLGISAQKKLITNDDFLAFITLHRDVMKVITSEYRNNPKVVEAITVVKTAQTSLDAVKKAECPATYVFEQRVREIKKAVVSLLGKGEVVIVGGRKVESVQMAMEMLLSLQVATVQNKTA